MANNQNSTQHSYIIGTININGVHNDTKIQALISFIYSNQLDIVCLQEVIAEDIIIPGFVMIFNVDENRRGTALAVRDGIKITNTLKSLDSRVICITIEDTVTILNLYAPSGSNNRAQREVFFSQTVPFYLQSHREFVVIAGDFNAVVVDVILWRSVSSGRWRKTKVYFIQLVRGNLTIDAAELTFSALLMSILESAPYCRYLNRTGE